MKLSILLVVFPCILFAGAAMANSWRMSLHKKALLFEENVLRNHWIEGLYPSIVALPPDGSPPDQTTAGRSNVAHSSSWTGNYLAGQAYRYAFTRDESVRRHCDEILQALHRLQEMTGIPGFLARGYLRGHGPSYEERDGASTSRFWHQGAGKWKDWRWRGSPSHHNYDDVIHGYGAYYDLAADDKQKEMMKRDMHALLSYIVDNDMNIFDEYGSREPFIGTTDGKTPDLRTIMVTSCLKIAYHITGDEKFNRAYQKLVDQYGYRKRTTFPAAPRRTEFDDTEHVLGDLDNMFRMEKDPELLRFYRAVLEAIWESNKDDRQAYYTFMHCAISGQRDEQRLQAAIQNLRDYPTDKIFRPKMNSIRPEVKKVGGLAEEPLPMYERPLDNEYEWKNNPYSLDGWMSREIASIDAAPEDPAVIYAADQQGSLYRSLDGDKTWEDISAVLAGARVRSVAASIPRMRIVFVATDRGVYRSTNGGTRWELVLSGNASLVIADAASPNRMYAITEAGVWRSLDLGDEDIGERWHLAAEAIGPGTMCLVPGKDPIFLTEREDRIYAKRGAAEWQLLGELPYSGDASQTLWLSAPAHDTIYAAVRIYESGVDFVGLWRTLDGGKTWTAIVGDGLWAYIQSYTKAVGMGLRGRIEGIASHPSESNTLFAATSAGVFCSRDAGDTWKACNDGLEIPRASGIFVTGGGFYAATPAGLFESDTGEKWKSANLVLIGPGVTTEETGSADYLDAYWPGRYFGFITEDEANKELSQW
jgi:hypothetical protein